jgi:hypothetical protein
MVDVVRKLAFTEAAIEKLGRRQISPEEARQLVSNFYVVFRNERRGQPLRRRRLMVGTTAGGRVLTLVIEPTFEPTDWLVITGWDSANHERRMLRR